MPSILFIILFMLFTLNAENNRLSDIGSLTLRMAKRDSLAGDTEILVRGKDLIASQKQEVLKQGCRQRWEKSCWDEKSSEYKLSETTFIELRDLIVKNHIMEIKSGTIPAPGEIQYSIGILEKDKEPVYINLTEKEAKQNKRYKKVLNYFEKLF
jgi:hypothetical protein